MIILNSPAVLGWLWRISTILPGRRRDSHRNPSAVAGLAFDQDFRAMRGARRICGNNVIDQQANMVKPVAHRIFTAVDRRCVILGTDQLDLDFAPLC